MSELPNPDGREWLGRFLEAQGKAQFQMLWMTFAIGQVGAAAQFGPREVTEEMVEQMDLDIQDLRAACHEMVDVAHSILINAHLNLAKAGDDESEEVRSDGNESTGGAEGRAGP